MLISSNNMMGIKEILSNDYLRLFVKREGRVVLGKRYASLWLLCCVLLVTFLAIAFSNASLWYLALKMDDPFINWVDINNNFADDKFVEFEEALKDETLSKEYHYSGYQTDKYWYVTYFTKDHDTHGLRSRCFGDIATPLVQAILSEENVISKNRIDNSGLISDSYGVIITEDALIHKLGYTGKVPAYIYHYGFCNYQAEAFGIKIYEDMFAAVPLPVLAVVKRLPFNMDIICTKHLYNMEHNGFLNLDNEKYTNNLLYFVPKSVDYKKFSRKLRECGETLGAENDAFFVNDSIVKPRIAPFVEGRFMALRMMDESMVDYQQLTNINNTIEKEYGRDGVYRVYEYDGYVNVEDSDDYISIHFADLNKVRDFQEFAKERFNINIEMSQINAKENFNEVSIMANILSWTMIVFAVVCIILFIVNLLQSYFQKVKRNLGTFKAFGISNQELITIYVLIMVATIFVAIVISLILSLLIQETLPLLGVLKDGKYDFLSLWSNKTFYSIAIIIISSIVTVYAVMHKLLKLTPGDLIYDR